MHELAITKQVIQDIMDVVKEKKIEKVKRVVVEVGKLTTYKVEPIKYYFNQLRKEHPQLKKTIFEGRNVAGEETILKEIEVK